MATSQACCSTDRERGWRFNFDDTIQEKAWTDENDLICWHYDHVSGRTVKGINLLNALYHHNGVSIPVDFRLGINIRCELKTREVKRKSGFTKNELMRDD